MSLPKGVEASRIDCVRIAQYVRFDKLSELVIERWLSLSKPAELALSLPKGVEASGMDCVRIAQYARFDKLSEPFC